MSPCTTHSIQKWRNSCGARETASSTLPPPFRLPSQDLALTARCVRPESIDARPPSWVPNDEPEKLLRALAHERLLQLKGQEKMSYSNVLFDVYDYIQKEVRASAVAPAPVVRALLQCGLHLFCGL